MLANCFCTNEKGQFLLQIFSPFFVPTFLLVIAAVIYQIAFLCVNAAEAHYELEKLSERERKDKLSHLHLDGWPDVNAKKLLETK